MILVKVLNSITVKYADDSTINITRMLRYLSRVSEVRLPLARHEGILNALKKSTTYILQQIFRI